MNFLDLQTACQCRLNAVQNAEKHLHALHAKSVDLSAQLDAAGEALATAKAARAQHPEQAHLTAAVTAATGKFEALTDASELNLRSIEQATRACVDAQAALTAAEVALAPVKAEHDQQMQAAHDAKRKAYDTALPSVRKLVGLLGDGAVEAFAEIVKNGCENPLPTQFVEHPKGSIFEQMAAAQASSAPVNLMALMHPVTQR